MSKWLRTKKHLKAYVYFSEDFGIEVFYLDKPKQYINLGNLYILELIGEL